MSFDDLKSENIQDDIKKKLTYIFDKMYQYSDIILTQHFSQFFENNYSFLILSTYDISNREIIGCIVYQNFDDYIVIYHCIANIIFNITQIISELLSKLKKIYPKKIYIIFNPEVKKFYNFIYTYFKDIPVNLTTYNNSSKLSVCYVLR